MITGFIGNQKVAERRFVRDARLTTLEAAADQSELSSEYADDTRVTLRTTAFGLKSGRAL